MTPENEDQKLKDRELEIRAMELKHKKFIEALKIITTGVVVTLIPAIINHQIQNQEIEIKRLDSEIVYLEKFSNNVVEQEDLAKRRNFVEYLATIAHSENSRARWNTYLGLVDELAKKQKAFDLDLNDKASELENLENQINQLEAHKVTAIEQQSSNLTAIEDSIKVAKQRLKTIEQALVTKANERQDFIKDSKLSDTQTATADQIQKLVLEVNSLDKSTRLIAVSNLIKNYSASSRAINLALDLLEMPLLETLSASGRINVFVFLRNTNRAVWDSDQITRAKDAIALIRRRSNDNIVQIGSQTEDALSRLEGFLGSN